MSSATSHPAVARRRARAHDRLAGPRRERRRAPRRLRRVRRRRRARRSRAGRRRQGQEGLRRGARGGDRRALARPRPGGRRPPRRGWQVLPYERQLEVKAAQVDEALRRIGRLDGFELEPIVPAEQQWRYRNKVEFSFGTGEEGELVCGFHAPGRWNDIVPMADCMLVSERVNALREQVLAFCHGLPGVGPARPARVPAQPRRPRGPAHGPDAGPARHLGGQDRGHQQAAAAHPRRPVDGLHARRRARLRGDPARPRQGVHRTRSSTTPWPSSPTAPPCSASATSARRPRCPSWRARRCCSRSSPASTRSRSASTPRTSTRSSPTVRRSRRRFGGINLEDISAPRCFEIEERLQAELDIPVFHDDQHGTAIVVLAALLNALKLTGKRARGPARPDRRRSAPPASRSPRCSRRPACATSSAATRAARSTRSGPTTSTADDADQALVRGGHQRRLPRRRSGRRDRRRRPVHRPLGRRASCRRRRSRG